MTNRTTFTISIELGALIPPSAPLTRDAFPHLAHAVEAAVARAHEIWSEFARGAPLPTGEVITNRTGEYLRSIHTRTTGDFAGVVYSELPYAKAIEEGTPQRDMKRMLNSSLKVRLTKDGRRYLIIPFRFNTPGSRMGNAMPVQVHRWWQKEGRSRTFVAGTYNRISGTGAFDIGTRKLITVPGWRYRHAGADKKQHKGFGTRLGTGDLEGMGLNRDDKATKRMVGMYNFRQPGATGGAAQSKFLTFRVMTEGAPGWIAPARPGLFPARTTTDLMRPVCERAFEEAASADVLRLLGG